MRIFAGRVLLGAALLLLSILPAFLNNQHNQAFADGTGPFEGAAITKIAGIDAINNALGSGNATAPFVDSIDWHGMNDTEGFFIFRYCESPDNCLIGSATPDGKFIEKAFDPPAQYSSMSGAEISPGGDALLFKAKRGDNNEELYIFIKGANSLVQVTNGTQVPTYSWMPDARVAYSELKAEISCGGGISSGQCNDPQYNADSRIWVARPTGERTRTLYQEHSSVIDFALSPDGKKLAYVAFEGIPSDARKVWKLSVYDFDAGSAKAIASNRNNEGYFFVRWAPSGEAIMYMTLDQSNPAAPSGRLNLVKPDGTELGRVALSANSTSTGALTFGPAISDDGSKVIFAVNQDIHEGGIDGPGIYSMQLAHPIPEFPLTALLLALPVAVVVAVVRVRAGK